MVWAAIIPPPPGAGAGSDVGWEETRRKFVRVGVVGDWHSGEGGGLGIVVMIILSLSVPLAPVYMYFSSL